MNARIPSAALLLAAFVVPQIAQPATVVSTINGYYDVDYYDTPSLHIDNSSAYAFTNVQVKLTGYQGLNNGVSETIGVANIAAGTTAILTWGLIPGANGSMTAGNLSSYDYDDEYGGTFAAQVGYGLSSSHTLVPAPQCAAQGWSDCAQVGNFYVTFTATWNGQSIYSQFSPDPTLPGAGNVAGTFVGWEGLAPNGWSETSYDSHSAGGPNGVLADILLGTPPPPPTTAPEPATASFLAVGIVMGIAGLLRRKAHPVNGR